MSRVSVRSHAFEARRVAYTSHKSRLSQKSTLAVNHAWVVEGERTKSCVASWQWWLRGAVFRTFRCSGVVEERERAQVRCGGLGGPRPFIDPELQTDLH